MIHFTDYKGEKVCIPEPKSSIASIRQRSYDMSRSYYTTGMPPLSYTNSELEDKYKRWQASAQECFYCGRKTNEHLQRDHLIPNSHTGDQTGEMVAHTIYEFVPCCSCCNAKKGCKDPVKWYTSDETVRYLKDECGLSDSRYEAKLNAMKEDCEKLGVYNIDKSFYNRADRDLAIKDGVIDILDKMAHDRMSGILQRNGVKFTCKEQDLPSEEDFQIWDEIEEILVKHHRMKRSKNSSKMRMSEDALHTLF